MNRYPDRVTLDDLAAADDEIAALARTADELSDALAMARAALAGARQHQHHLLARYHRQAAAPLYEPR